MLLDAIHGELPNFRAQAEALMVDACMVTEPGGAPVWNETTGTYDAPTATTVYAGRCRVQVPNLSEQTVTAGERPWTLQEAILNLPVVGSESVEVGHTVTITAATHDDALAGRRYTVVAEHAKTFATSRRLRIKEVTE